MAKTKITEAIALLQKVGGALDGGKDVPAWRFAIDADKKLCEALSTVAGSIPPKKAIAAAISRAMESVALASSLASTLDARSRKDVRSRLHALVNELSVLKDSVGPLKHPPFVFDPAGFDVIAHVAATALFAQPKYSLTKNPEHWGSGIYALYYAGSLEFYRPISGTDTPIYVGSAAPSLHNAIDPEFQGDSLFGRIAEHRGSIQEVASHARGNLKISEFYYRFIVVKSGWELAAEQYLIRYFRPVWNKETRICTGIGKHGDASKTRGNSRSLWDTVHPGRPWTLTRSTKASKKTASQIQQDIEEHFKKHPPRTLDIKDLLT